MGFNVFGGIKNIGKFVNAATKFKNNPNGAINEALLLLEKKNPNAAKIIRAAINSNKNPAQFIEEQAANGKITKQNLQDLKSYYGFAKSAGLEVDIPKSVWDKAERAIKSVGSKNGNSVFTGF